VCVCVCVCFNGSEYEQQLRTEYEKKLQDLIQEKSEVAAREAEEKEAVEAGSSSSSQAAAAEPHAQGDYQFTAGSRDAAVVVSIASVFVLLFEILKKYDFIIQK
jgi:hypothetical protein